jgi:ABC-type nitrate/sulfonate/bicarbonate transport system substrate-binding protein
MRVSRRGVLRVGVTAGAALALPGGPAWGRSAVKGTQVTAVLYAAHLVAEAGGYFKKEGIEVELLTSPAGARSAQMAAAGQVHYVLGDTSHPQRLTEQGKPTVILFVTDQKCPYANVLNVAKGIKAEKTYPFEEIVDGSFLAKAAGRATAKAVDQHLTAGFHQVGTASA